MVLGSVRQSKKTPSALSLVYSATVWGGVPEYLVESDRNLSGKDTFILNLGYSPEMFLRIGVEGSILRDSRNHKETSHSA